MFNFIVSLVNQNATFAVVVLGILAYIIALVVAIVGHELSHGFIAYVARGFRLGKTRAYRP